MNIPPLIWDRLRALGISQFYPPQERALHEWVPGKNIVVAIPTAAGKTLIAEVIMVQDILMRKGGGRGKVLYLTPLKALATEKYQSFKEHWEQLGISTTFATGDFDRVDRSLFSYDIIVMTNEKADSVLRTHPELMQAVTCVVVDEIHLLNDETRGVTLELVLTKIRKLIPTVQIIGLSATINNAGELAKWLDGLLIQDDWRPVKLKEGVFYEHKIVFSDGTEQTLPGYTADPIETLLIDTIKGGGQVLAFLNTRRNAMAAGKRFAQALMPLLTPELRERTQKAAGEFAKLEPENPPQAKQLIELLRSGVAFHHAGLTYSQRTFVEDQFRRHNILAIAATPTLAAGINTPARRVIIRGLARFSKEQGNEEVPVIEYKQMAGRAGRPGFDPYGEAVVIARNPTHFDELMEKYVKGTPEDITSKLNNEAELKSHLLGTIASGFTTNWGEIISFFHLTFFSFQRGSALRPQPGRKRNGPKRLEQGQPKDDYFKYVRTVDQENLPSFQFNPSREKKLEESLHDALSYLISETMVKEQEGNVYEITPLGRKVSQLYIKPESAVEFRAALRVISQRISTHDLKLTTLSFLHAISRFPDSYLPYAGEAEKEGLRSFYQKHATEFVFPRKLRPETGDLEDLFPELKLCAILFRWIQEVPEDRLASDFNVGAGDIRRYVETAEWLVHAAEVLSSSFNAAKWGSALKQLAIRVKYGCGEELLPLVSIYDIGRVRGRILFKAGFKTPGDVLSADSAVLSKLPTFGPEIVAKIKRNIDAGKLKIDLSNPETLPEKKPTKSRGKQATLI